MRYWNSNSEKTSCHRTLRIVHAKTGLFHFSTFHFIARHFPLPFLYWPSTFITIIIYNSALFHWFSKHDHNVRISKNFYRVHTKFFISGYLNYNLVMMIFIPLILPVYKMIIIIFAFHIIALSLYNLVKW